MPIINFTDQQWVDFKNAVKSVMNTVGYRPGMGLPLTPQQVQRRSTAAGQDSGLYRYKSQGSNGDYIVCSLAIVAADGSITDGGPDTYINIAKPFLLRRTPFDGHTYNSVAYTYSSAVKRVATVTLSSGSVAFTEYVTADYVLNDLIRAVSGPTGVLDDAGTPQLITLEDINNSGRRWENGTA